MTWASDLRKLAEKRSAFGRTNASSRNSPGTATRRSGTTRALIIIPQQSPRGSLSGSHDVLPFLGPRPHLLCEVLDIGESQARHFLGRGDLLLGEARRPVADVWSARADEVAEAESALDFGVEAEVDELEGELLVLGADRHAGRSRERYGPFLRNRHADREAAIDIIRRASAPVRCDPNLLVLHVGHGRRRGVDHGSEIRLQLSQKLPGFVHVPLVAALG